MLIPKTIKYRLNELCLKLDCPAPYLEQVALTEEQIAEFNLPTRQAWADRVEEEQ